MITLRGATSDSLQTTFKVGATKSNFGIYPVTINTFSSIYADSNNLDIMIATVDGIDGPLNKITYNGFFLINAFTQTSSVLNTLNMGFLNYQSSTPMDGSIVPTMLRIKGSISGNSSTFDTLVVFFDKLTPFFSNYESGEIYCYNTGSTYPCIYYQGASTITTGN
jgi:hypothetical protein